MKKLFIILAALAFLAGSSHAITYNALQLPSLPSGYTNAVVSVGTDNTIDLGTSTKEFRNAYFDGTMKVDTLTVDESLTVASDVTVSGIFGIGTAEIMIISTGTTITPSSTYVTLLGTSSGSSGYVMASAPYIVATNFSEGDYLVLTTTGSQTFSFLEGAGYDMQLGATRVLGQFDTLTLIYKSSSAVAGSSWFQEVSFVNN